MDGIRDARKRRAGRAAAGVVADGDVVGLGSGSTAAYAIRAIGEQVDEGWDIVGVPTSYQAADLAREVGVPVRTPADVEGIDIAIDGADQVAGMDLIKGGGGAHTREKVIAAAAERVLIVVDDGKIADTLDEPIPVEVLPDARSPVAERLRALDGDPRIRVGDAVAGPAVTDNGNHIIDCAFGRIESPGRLADSIAGIPGVLDHGLFVGLADTIYVGEDDDVTIQGA